MSRMSVAYQCWEIVGGPTVGYKLAAHAQGGHGHGHQYVSDGSPFRRHHNPHETCGISSFSMYMQAPSDPKAHNLAAPAQQPKDAAARFAAAVSHSPLPQAGSSPLAGNGSPRPPAIPTEAASGASPRALSDARAAGSSLTSDSDGKASGAVVSSPCEAKSRMVGGGPGVPGMLQQGNLSKLHGSILLPDRGLRVKVAPSKPGVVERVAPVAGLLPSGPVFGSLPMEQGLLEYSSESSSSICNGSDDSSCTSEDTLGDTEVQSRYRGPLNQMAALESSLPIKRPGLSKFFGGKSRSFSSLADVSTVNDLAKPNNPYAKRRKMGFNCPLDRHRSYPPLSKSSVGGISKRLPSSGSRSTLAVAVKLGGVSEEPNEQVDVVAPTTLRSSENRTLPSRSFSLTDLPVAGSPPPLRRTFARS